MADNVYVLGDITSNSIIVENNALYVYSGETVNNIIVSSGGVVYVSRGGTANGIIVESGSYLYVSNGGTATNIDWTPCVGQIFIRDGGTATFVSEYSGVYYGADDQLLSHAAILENKEIDRNTRMFVMSGGTANGATIISGGAFYVSGGGTANNTTIISSGYLYVSNGGIANNTLLSEGWGTLYLYSGGTVNDTVISGGNCSLNVFSGGTANRTVVNSGVLYVSYGGLADNTTLNRGYLIVSNSGIANNTTVNSGWFYISYGGVVNGAVLNNGSFYIENGGIANAFTISGGTLFISSGGTATDIDWTPCNGRIFIHDGGTATFVSEYSGVYYGADNQLLSHAAILEDKVIGSNGDLFVMAGGTANNAAVNSSGFAYVSSGGTANNISVDTFGQLHISSGATVTAIKENGGTVIVDDGADVTFAANEFSDQTVTNWWSATVHSGTTATRTTLSACGQLFVSSGGTANETNVNYGYLYVSDGGIANDTVVNSGWLYVSSGGIANGIVVNYGVFYVFSGGTANGAVVSSGGSLYVSGGKLTGKMVFENGAVVSLSQGAILDFDLTQMTAEDEALVNNLSVIQGTVGYTLTVDGPPANGVYLLAEGASKFNSVITVQTVLGESLGTLTVGETLTVSDTNYTLNLNDDVLSVTVFTPEIVVFSGVVVANESRTVGAYDLYENTTINFNGDLIVDSRGATDNTTINSGGNLLVSAGGAADHTVINSGGSFYISGWGSADNTTVNAGGSLSVAYGATATGVLENGGYVDIRDIGANISFVPNAIDNLTLKETSATLHSGTTANSAVVETSGALLLYSGGTADCIAVNSGGSLVISGGTADSTTVNSGGRFYLCSGGTADNITVNSGGRLYISSGGTAAEVLENGGYVTVGIGADVTFVPNVLDDFVLNGASATIHSGTTANNATVDSGGTLYICSGGTANGVAAVNGGYLIISSGGTAAKVLENGGYVIVDESADVTFTPNVIDEFLVENVSATIHSGTTANTVTIDEDGYLEVYSGGIADTITVNPGGWLEVYEGGTATEVLENGGWVYAYDDENITFVPNVIDDLYLDANATIHSGTTANRIEIGPYGYLEVYSGGTATDIVWTPTIGNVRVLGGGYATFVNEYSGVYFGNGRELISSGMTLSSVMVGYDGKMYVMSEGVADHIYVSGGSMHVCDLGTVTNTTVDYGALYISSGGTANNVAVVFDGRLYVSSGGTANNIAIVSAGRLDVLRGGAVSGVLLNNGQLTINSSGAATDVTVNSGGRLTGKNGVVVNGRTIVNSGGRANHITLSDSILTVSGGKVTDITVDSGGRLEIFDRGVADYIYVNSGGSLQVFSGGSVRGIAVFSGGIAAGLRLDGESDLNVSSGGTVNDTIISGGYFIFQKGGTANNTTIVNGTLNVNKYAVANRTTVAGGILRITSDGTANGIVLNDGNLYVSGGTANDVVMNYGSFSVQKDGVVNGAVVNNNYQARNVRMDVGVGGTANDVILSGGTLVLMGGVANNTLVSCSAHPEAGDCVLDGRLVISSGGTATNTVVYGIWNSYFANLPGGIVQVMAKGVASNTSVGSGGRLVIDNGGNARDTIVGGYPMLSGRNDDDVYSGTVEVVKGGTATNVTLNYGGHLIVSGGGSAYQVVENGGCVDAVDGANVTFASNTFSGLILSSPISGGTGGISATVHSGTTAVDVTVMNSGFLTVYSGGKLTGRIYNLGGSISAFEGAIVDFDLTQTIPGAAPRIGDLSGIKGTPTFTVTAGADQAEGVYLLARGASQFNGTITVVNTVGDELGTLTVGETTDISGVGYTLTLSDGILSLKVGETNTPFPYFADELVLSGLDLVVEKDLIFHDTLICSGGSLQVSSDGVADGVVLNPGGSLIVRNGGTAVNVVENGGYVEVLKNADVTFAPNTFSNALIMQNEGATLHSGTTACNTKLAGTLLVYDGGVADVVDPLHLYRTPHNQFSIKVSSGGLANSVTLANGGCVMDVFDGGVASNTLITSFAYGSDYGGRLTIFSGGTAIDTVIDRGYGRMVVSSGGTAINTTISSGGNIEVFKSGRADGIVVGSGSGSIFVYSGGTATGITGCGGYLVSAAKDATVSFDGYVMSGVSLAPVYNNSTLSATVYSGMTALSASLGRYCSFQVYSGGVAKATSVNERGSIFVSSGGIADSATIFAGGMLVVSSGGTANNTIIFRDGLEILSGGTANNTVLRNNAGFSISAGMEANNTIVSGGSLFVVTGKDYTEVTSGGTANGVTVISGGLFISSGGFATGVTVSGVGSMFVSRGGSASGVVMSGGSLTIDSGTVDDITFYGRGERIVTVLRGGILNNAVFYDAGGIISGTINSATINKGNTFSVRNGAANDTIINQGKFELTSGTKAERTTLNSGTLYVYSGCSADGTILNGGRLNVSYNGTADNTTINSGGRLSAGEGAVANGVTVNYKGRFENYGTANSVTVNSGGTFFAGGTVNSTTVISGGQMRVNGGVANGIVVDGGDLSVNGGRALDIVWTPCEGHVRVNGGRATFVSQYSGVYYGSDNHLISSAATMESMTLGSSCEMYVMTDGTATGTTVNAGGRVFVASDGVADSTVVNAGGSVNVSRGGAVDNCTVNEGGTLSVSSGGTAMNIAASDEASLCFAVASETYIRGTSGGVAFEMKDAFLSDYTVNSGWIDVYEGGTAKNITINDSLYVYDGGVVQDIVLNSEGWLEVNDGGLVDNVTIKSGSEMWVYYMGKVTGKMTFEEGAVVSLDHAYLNFDLTQTTAGAEALVNDLSIIEGAPLYTLTADYDFTPGSHVYALADGAAGFNSTITVVNNAGDELGTLTVGETVKIGYNDYTLNLVESTLSVTVDAPDLTPQAPVGTVEQVSWEASDADRYIVEYSMDNFEHVIRIETTASAADMLELPAGTYQWRVKADENSDWAVGESIVSELESDTPKVVQAVEDGSSDLFFAAPSGTWSNIYFAQHVGSVNDWEGTNETVSAKGRGRIQNLFFGSADPNVLCLTDGENGDGIFVDDVYTALPEEIKDHMARLYRIQEIRAGAGDDIVDMTSQRFEYTGDGLTIRGGDGDDVIWANKGNNRLFGDDGNDRIVGASGDDVIVGGAGNDSMRGGGGCDIFVFCENWGVDTVDLSENELATLWFASGDESNWDAETLTYTDGENSVTVSGIFADLVILKFGDDGSEEFAEQFAELSAAGAFDAYTSRKIFEESTTGAIASL